MRGDCCRYRATECTGQGTQRNRDGSHFESCTTCTGPGDGTTEPESDQEEETVETTDTCPECGRSGLALYSCKHDPEGRKICSRCAAKMAYRAKTGAPARKKGALAPVKPASTKKHASPPPRPSAPEKSRQRPAQPAAAPSAFVPATPTTLVGALQRECVVLRIVCHEIEHVRRVLAVTGGLDVHVGLEG